MVFLNPRFAYLFVVSILCCSSLPISQDPPSNDDCQGDPIILENAGLEGLVEGDIVIDEWTQRVMDESSQQKRDTIGRNNPERLWSSGRVPVVYDSTLSE